jgi:glycosyltransferase involved in cell wall biosynthesis
VVTLRKAARILVEVHGVPARKIVVIPHGAPEKRRQDPVLDKETLGLSDRTVVSTIGFLSSGKGIEYCIKALKILAREFPNIVYLIVGETHPNLKKHEGEAYRHKLERLVHSLSLSDHVIFVDRFVSDEELAVFLNATDVYVAPYRGRDQVSSGTITEAMAQGKPVVATPTVFAEETLAGGRGLFCRFDDEHSIASQTRRILANDSLRQDLETRAREYGQQTSWKLTAQEYVRVLSEAATPRVCVALAQ